MRGFGLAGRSSFLSPQELKRIIPCAQIPSLSVLSMFLRKNHTQSCGSTSFCELGEHVLSECVWFLIVLVGLLKQWRGVVLWKVEKTLTTKLVTA